MSQKDDINILLLGETGAGKSTTLNALANYFKFNNFDEALKNLREFTEVISSSFVLPDPSTGDSLCIKSGPQNENEVHEEGNSCTQSPVSYTFTFGNRKVRIIDTPGVGDTSGVDNDKRNFEKILETLQNYKHLNGVLFIVRGNESRKTTFFKYCITELLTHLHNSISKNIVFCFTHSRSSFFGPGDGFSTLKTFIENDMENVQLKLIPSGGPNSNCFFIDNEAYRFFVAKRQNYPFRNPQEKHFKESWDESCSQIEMMINSIADKQPHDLINTISLNNSRKIIIEMTTPIVKLQENISRNLKQIIKFETELKTSTKTKKELAKKLKLEITDVKMRPLEKPLLVCTSEKSGCAKFVLVNDDYESHSYRMVHNTKCHENCHCGYWVNDNRVGQTMIRFCKVMKGITKKCQTCGCKWNKHKRIIFEIITKQKSIIDPSKQNLIKTEEEAIKRIDEALDKAKEIQVEMNNELEIINEICSKFAYFLSENSFMETNNYYENYLDLLIDEEQKKPKPNAEHLKKMKEKHQENMKILKRAISNKSQEKVTANDVHRYQKDLLSLKHSGATFSNMLNTTKSLCETDVSHTEITVLKISKTDARFSSLSNQFKALSM